MTFFFNESFLGNFDSRKKFTGGEKMKLRTKTNEFSLDDV